MNASLTRPKFDAAVDACQLPAEYHEALWRSLRAVLTGKLAHDPHKPRPSWTPEAIDLREPLRREIEACRKRDAEGLIFSRFDTLEVPLPSGKRIRVTHAFNAYRESLAKIQERMDHVLREGGHWRPRAVDGQSTAPEPQPIAVLVANEKAAGRAAGTRDWVQWEEPTALKALTHVFDEANKLTPARRKWFPYCVPTSSLSERGIASDTKRAQRWRTAFNDALAMPIEQYQLAAELAPDDPRPAATLAFWKALRDEPDSIAAITDACTHQARKHRSPANPRFQPPRSIWHALTIPARRVLAARFDALARFVDEATFARGGKPQVHINPFELTEDERNEHAP